MSRVGGLLRFAFAADGLSLPRRRGVRTRAGPRTTAGAFSISPWRPMSSTRRAPSTVAVLRPFAGGSDGFRRHFGQAANRLPDGGMARQREPRAGGRHLRRSATPMASRSSVGALADDVLQAGTSDWPSSGEGMAIAMSGHIDSSRVVELGWFAIIASSPGTVEVIPHPNPQFASRFATARFPVESPIADLGVLGFGVPGRVPVMDWPGSQIGAACVRDTICAMLTEKEAGYYGENAVWFGEGTPCSWELCRPDAPLGACCFEDAVCERLREKDCLIQKGIFRGAGSRCEPENPCRAAAGKAPQGGGQ